MEEQMPKKPTTAQITRRDAVAMLGAGPLMGVVRPARQGSTVPGRPDPSCKDPADVTTFSNGTRDAFISYSCCFETKNAVLTGVEEPGYRATPTGKAHLAPVRDRLIADRLDEYCYMIWGLSKEQVQELSKLVPERFKLNKREAPKSKK
jgi:hypothetical protein